MFLRLKFLSLAFTELKLENFRIEGRMIAVGNGTAWHGTRDGK